MQPPFLVVVSFGREKYILLWTGDMDLMDFVRPDI